MKTALKYGAVLIAIYLGVSYATGAGTLLNGAAKGTEGVVKVFQGRG